MINRRMIAALALALPVVAATVSCARDYDARPQSSVETATTEPSFSARPSSTAHETATARPTTASPTLAPRTTTPRTTTPRTTTAQPAPSTTRPAAPAPSWYALALRGTGEYRWYTDYPSQNAVISAIQADGYYTTQEGRAIFDSGCAAFAHPMNNYSNSAFQYGAGSGATRSTAETTATQQCQQANGVLCDTYISLCVGD